MKGILEFDLEDSHEKLAHKRALKATEAYIAIFRMSEEIFRHERKHGLYPSYMSELEDRFYEILDDLDVRLEDLE
jgi:hypothetical protein